MKRIVVTGANGFIGTNLIKVLSEKADILPVAMIYPGTEEKVLENFRCEKFYGDMMKSESMNENFRNADCVIHLAGLVTEWGAKELFDKYITEATKIVFECAAVQKVKKFIYMSSLTIHGFEGFDENCSDENTLKKPYNHYASAKLAAEQYIIKRGKEEEIDIIIIRPGFTIFGEYDKTSFIQYLDAIAEKRAPYLNHGRYKCSFVYAENLARGIAFLYNHPNTNGPYIIVDANLTWKEFIEKICEIGGFERPSSSVPYKLVYLPIWILETIYKIFRIKKSPILNTYRLKIQATDLAFSGKRIEKLGFKAPVEFDEAIQKTIEYYKSEYKKD